MRWVNDTARYASGQILYLGRWKVGGFYYDSSKGATDLQKWKATCSLPGMRVSLGYFVHIADAQKKVEDAVNYWLEGTTEYPKTQNTNSGVQGGTKESERSA